jgi:hypothetical protein
MNDNLYTDSLALVPDYEKSQVLSLESNWSIIAILSSGTNYAQARIQTSNLGLQEQYQSNKPDLWDWLNWMNLRLFLRDGKSCGL